MLFAVIRNVLGIFAAAYLTSALNAEEWRVFTDTKGRTLEARVVTVLDDEARVVLKRNNRETPLRFELLCKADRDYLREWSPDDGKKTAEVVELSSRLYPKDLQEIEKGIREIEARKAPGGVTQEQQKTVNELNIYRFLCGVPYEVEADQDLVEHASEAAAACQEHGLSHDLGSFTDKCNLSSGSSMLSSVRNYIDDAGAHNKEKRGHRRWCLNPSMEVTGFGAAGDYSAMWAMDKGGRTLRDTWSYPGKGLFPADRLHGDGWSLYLTENAPEKDRVTVEVFKLEKRPESPFGWTGDIPGTPVEVVYVSTYKNAVNFEPKVEGTGVYWVRIRGSGLREQYVVELY